MRALLAFILLFWTFSGAVAQQVVDSPEADQTALTIYPDNLAMITETRKVNVPAGRSTIRFLGVSDQIIAQTAVLQSFNGFSLESNFDSDLITRGALLNKAIGSDITIRRINPSSGKVSQIRGKLISASNINNVIQGAILETSEGIEALECAGLAEAVVFSSMPKDLNPKPVLSMNVESKKSGEAEMTLSYLSQGIGWEADYRLDVGDNQSGEGPLTGWLTVTNNTAKTFKDVPTAIIAGKLNRDKDTRSSYVAQKRFSSYCWRKGSSKTGIPAGLTLYQHGMVQNGVSYARGGSAAYAPQPVMAYADYAGEDDEIIVTGTKRQATLEDFADYKLYRVPQPVTVAAMQTKQIAFLDVENAEYERVYKTDLDWWDIDVDEDDLPYNAQKFIEIDNSRDGNLAKPLPKGNVLVMTKRASGQIAYLGEAGVKDMAVDLPVELSLDESPFVQVLPTLKLGSHEGLAGVMVGVDVFNPMPEMITFEFTLNSTSVGLDDIQGSTHPRKMDEARPVYKFPVEAETRTPFYLFFEYLSSQHFSYDDVVYDSDEPGDTDVIYSTPSFSLKNGGGKVEWLEDLVDQLEDRDGDLKMKATLVAAEEFEDSEDYEGRVSESFKFSNKSSVDQIVTFDFDDLDVVLEKSNFEPDDSSLLAWRFEVKAGESVTLDITYLLEW